MEITDALLVNYLPYAKGVIIDRAIPSIDGLKPSQRKILYTMYTMGLLKKDKTKSTNIVGATMRIHPHSDQSIYDTFIHLATGNETLNVPYIESKGNFGKVYSRDLAYAASRYTEAKLAPVCAEIFEGIDEDAVEFVNNYDDTTVEPTLLPVKFPTILVNPSNGIAVGMSSSIPSFGLKNVCKSVIGIIDGSIKNASDLTLVLGIPEFTTGGNVHTNKEMMEKLVETGKGSILMTGKAVLYPNKIIITEIPYKTTSESIIEAIESYMKDELKEIADVKDSTGLSGFQIDIQLKRGANPTAVLNKIMRLTPFRTQISFNTRVIIGDDCKDPGLFDLLNYWIAFRKECIKRMYTFRYNKQSEREHLLRAWEAIKLDIRKVANLIANKNETEAKEELMTAWKLDEEQADYILDMRIREFTQDRLNKHINELNKLRDEMKANKAVIDSDAEKYKIIVREQNEIIEKYAKENKTHIRPVIDLKKEREEANKVVIDDEMVTIVITKSGLCKRLITMNDHINSSLPDGEEEWLRISTRNNHHLLIFTYDGTVHKLLANSIDAVGHKFKDNIAELVGVKFSDIFMIDDCGDYTKHFNVVYPNGKGYIVKYEDAIGKRSQYKNMFPACENNTAWYTFEDQFFIITRKRKAAYADVRNTVLSSRRAFKIGRISAGDYMGAIQPLKDVPDISSIDLDKYSRDYTVLIGPDDELWEGSRERYRQNREKALEQKALMRAAKKSEKDKDKDKVE